MTGILLKNPIGKIRNHPKQNFQTKPKDNPPGNNKANPKRKKEKDKTNRALYFYFLPQKTRKQPTKRNGK